jgi:hypothetical protein
MLQLLDDTQVRTLIGYKLRGVNHFRRQISLSPRTGNAATVVVERHSAIENPRLIYATASRLDPRS